jgi:hypothetical protein
MLTGNRSWWFWRVLDSSLGDGVKSAELKQKTEESPADLRTATFREDLPSPQTI